MNESSVSIAFQQKRGREDEEENGRMKKSQKLRWTFILGQEKGNTGTVLQVNMQKCAYSQSFPARIKRVRNQIPVLSHKTVTKYIIY